MPKINADQLANHCHGTLLPVYIISGDEPLLVQEACDILRQHARAQGFNERELYHTDSSLDWQQLLQSANSMSLFAERKIIEVRSHNSKPNEAGKNALLEYSKNPSPDTLLLLVFPKIERATQNTKWFKAIDAIAGNVQIWPVGAKAFHRWVELRLKSEGLKATADAIGILASKVEGNLLACVQEIQKLKLLNNDGIIDGQTLANAVVDSARYDIFTLVDRATSGDARAAVRTLQGLREEGTEATIILWALAREIRALNALFFVNQQGGNFNSIARTHGIFDKRLPLVRQALGRLKAGQLRLLLRQCALADRAIKGASKQNIWSLLNDITLMLAGVRALSARSLQQQLEQ
ncbi:DNA polymerase III subunit delta [Marinagarivorans algicola]|uniref:DNA polymerase III subunit delta n=1 Tax=Marinagarivorans algicola TaxID=1513270 RepID=UPI0006B693DA|nr:DNA polymerase III subunit delta [Marinagarivorans algicola]